MMKKSSEKSDDKVPPFLSLGSGSVYQAEISIISNEIKFYFIKSQIIEYYVLWT